MIKAVRIAEYGSSEQLKYEDAPLLRPGPDYVLARVSYAGVNPVDWKIREGYMKQVFPGKVRRRSGAAARAGSSRGSGFSDLAMERMPSSLRRRLRTSQRFQ